MKKKKKFKDCFIIFLGWIIILCQELKKDKEEDSRSEIKS